MPKSTSSLMEKITQSENKIKQLIEQRNKELLDIITKFNAISIDNKLLAGFLLFALKPENKNHHILKEFMELAKQTKSPSKPKQSNSVGTKKVN